VRHGATAGGAGDPPGFRLDDCATQRNLTDKGRAEARRLGEQLRSRDVAVGKLMSSQWCRCQETAALMELGPVELSPTFNNAFALRDRVGELTGQIRRAGVQKKFGGDDPAGSSRSHSKLRPSR
jgi:phosphohistidine phosphatase SixA